jgi:hypothetical protein
MTKTISNSHWLSPQLDDSLDLNSMQHSQDVISVHEHPSQAMDEMKLQIIHATAGRIRIRTNDSSWNSEIEHLSQDLKQQNWVLKIVTNQHRGSLIFTFDESQISLLQVLRVLTEFDLKYPSSAPKLDVAAWKSPGFWQKQSTAVIPLIAGLVVTRGLRVSGWPGILVYMLAADATQWLMDALEPGLLPAVVRKTTQKFTHKSIQLPGLTNVEKKSSSDIAVKQKVDYTIVYQIPGRIRFHLPPISQDSAYCKRLEKLLKADAEVMSFRVNCQAASLVINYQNTEISITRWVSLIELALLPELTAPEIFISVPDTQVLTMLDEETSIEIDLSSLWADLKPSMMSYSLSVMANFPL